MPLSPHVANGDKVGRQWCNTVFLNLLVFKSRLRAVLQVTVPVNQEMFIFWPKNVCFLLLKVLIEFKEFIS
jgi:hypothetical protein